MGEAYEEVCRELSRLCPRLVPSPLWGVSIARIVRTDPRILVGLLLGRVDEELVERAQRVREWWFSLPRERCAYCGSRASDIDEEWRYMVAGSEGVARLVNVVPVCRVCHLAKHLGYALSRGLYRVAVERLAELNGVDDTVLAKAIRRAFEIHSALSSVSRWRLVVHELPGLCEDERRWIEAALNAMAWEGIYISGCTIVWELESRGLEARRAELSDIVAALRRAGARILSLEDLARALEEQSCLCIALRMDRDSRGVAARSIALELRDTGFAYFIEVDACGGGDEVRVCMAPPIDGEGLEKAIRVATRVVSRFSPLDVLRVVALHSDRRVVVAVL